MNAKNTILSLAVVLLCLLAPTLKAQTMTDTTEVILGRRVITITVDSTTGKKDWKMTSDNEERKSEEDSVKSVDTDLIGVDLGFNWLMYNNSFDLPANESDFEIEPLRSTQVALHFLPTHFNMAKGKVSILSAITFENLKYQFRNDVTLVPNQPAVTMVADSVTFKKNKLSVWYGEIPLMLSLQTKPTRQGRNFHVALGGFAGLFLGANTKQRSVERGKVVQKDDYNLAPIRYGLTARIGYGNLELYSTYTLSNFFRDGQGPTFNNINFGIALTGMM